MAYRFDIQYKPTKDHGNADGLSRLSTEIDADFDRFESRENAEILCNIEEAIDGFPLTHDHVRRETLRVPTLKSISLYIQHNSWPKPTRLDNDLIPFFNQKNSLWVENDVISLQREGVIRVVIPSSLRKDILHLLHEAHWGAT